MDDLTPDRIEVEYVCTRSSCGVSSTWRRSFPESAFEKVEEMEAFFRTQLLKGVERRCGSCDASLRSQDVVRARYRCWSPRCRQDLVLQIEPTRKVLVTTYPVKRHFHRPDGDLEAVQSPHDPRLRSAMIDSILRAGALHAESGSLDEGIALIEKAIEMDPDHAMSRARLGEAYFRAGLVEETEAALRDALSRDPGCDVALDLLGRICHSQSRWGEAEAAFQRLRQIQGDRPEILLAQARAQVRLGRPGEAYETCVDLHRIDRGSIPALRIAAIHAEELEPERARALLQELREKAEDEPLQGLAEERLDLLSLPPFRVEVGEDATSALARLRAALKDAGLDPRSLDPGGYRVTLGRRSVALNVFPGGYTGPGMNDLLQWVRSVRKRFKAARIQVYAPTPCPYTVRKLTSALPEAILDVHSDDLLTDDPERNRATIEETFDMETLQDLDRILLEGYHDDGFGEIRESTAILFAHWVGEAIRREVEGRWLDGDPVRMLETPQGVIDLLGKVQSLVVNGAEDSLAYLREVLVP